MWRQIAVGMIVIVLFVALVAGELVRYIERDSLLATVNTQVDAIIEIFAAASLDAVISEDIPEIETIVEQAVEAQQNFHSLLVTDEEDTVLVRWQRGTPLQDDEMLIRSKPIILEGENFGRIRISMDMRRHYQAIDQQVNKARWISFAMLLLLTSALLGLLQVLVMHPLSRIAERIRDLSSGDLRSELNERSSRELTLLTDSVNHLAIALIEEEQHKRDLKLAKEQAEASSRSKSQFLSSMSHELRTPMNAILGFSELLETDTEEPLTEMQADSVHEISKAGRHLLELINDVLDLSRIEADRLTISMETLDMVELALECLALVEPVAERYGVNLHNQLSLETPVWVNADRVRTKQVLLNLLSNAIKYNRKGGDVSLLGPDIVDEFVRVRVDDTGPGLNAEECQRIFEPFSRLDDSNTIEGTGIGLTISRRLLDMMGGSIGVESVPGQGSSFWIDLQIEDQHVFPISLDDDVSIHSAEAMLLYIEDNPSNQRLMKQLMHERKDLGLIMAQQGKMGVELAQAHKPDLILLDIHLPDINGFEVREKLLESTITRDIPVIMISADATNESIRKGKTLGIADYFTKPLDTQGLLQRIDELLQARTN